MPTIAWGLDPAAHAVLKLYADSLAGRADRAETPEVFEPRTDELGEFRALVANIREAARRRQPPEEPAVILVVSAFAERARERLAIAGKVSELLETALPGCRSITLAVLLGPDGASDEEKIRTFEFFTELDALASELRHLDAIFVNRLTADLYRQFPACPVADEEIGELLYRELGDPELQRLIRGVGHAGMRKPIRVAGRKCCYSTAGACGLDYLRDEILAHLEARFAQELYTQGLMNREAVTEEDRDLIQRRADAWVRRLAAELAARTPRTPPVTADQLRETGDPEQAALAQAAFFKEVEQALDRRKDLDGVLQSLDDCVERELVAFLADAAGRLAAGQCFLEALDGPDAGDAPLFERIFSAEPYLRTVHDFFRPRLQEAALAVGEPAPDPAPDETALQLLSRWSRAVAARSRARDAESAPALRSGFLTAALTLALGQPGGTQQEARKMLRSAVDLLLKESAPAGDRLQEKLREREQLQGQLAALDRWWIRNFRRRAEYQAKRGAIADVEQAIQRLREVRAAAQRDFAPLVNDVLLPHITRSEIADRFRRELEKTRAAFNSFTASLASSLQAAFERAKIPEYARTTRRAVADHAVADKLYRRALDGRAFTWFVEQVLAFLPERPSGGQRRKLSYQDCRHLGDHYRAGAQPLLERMRDYTARLFLPTRRLDILDILELDGKEAASHRIRETAAYCGQFLGLSPADVPRLRDLKALQELFVVRVLDGPESRLAQRYGALFGTQAQFVDSGDAFRIHITCLTLGLPAFAIHSLAEARRLAFVRGGAPGADLWPEPAAQ